MITWFNNSKAELYEISVNLALSFAECLPEPSAMFEEIETTQSSHLTYHAKNLFFRVCFCYGVDFHRKIN